ncbi:hypothetical protein [Leifsonia sp. NPDC058230]|uniref:hypothetical protein n=1 Tax=Leifsonia sp. NPDC058230 TaxID=3346391 RepID=UPI0036DEA965
MNNATDDEANAATVRRALLGRAYRRRLLWCVVLGLAAGAVTWFFGVDIGHAVGFGAVAVAASACLSLVGDQARVDWLPGPAMPRDGARRDVVQLGWALHTRGGGVSPEAVRRLRTVAAQVLELHGLDLDDPSHRPAVERVLGADFVATIRRGTAASPKLGSYQAALATLGRLAESPPGPFTAVDAAIDTSTTPDANTRNRTTEEITDAR